VVDASPRDRGLIAYALRIGGFEVSTLHDGHELLEVLQMVPSRHFALVVADQCASALQAGEMLARRGAHRTRFIISSADDSPETRQQVADCGASAFLPKPLDVEGLVAMLDDVMMDETRPDGCAARSGTHRVLKPAPR
jgi:DNA-binding response OmpR family regulator